MRSNPFQRTRQLVVFGAALGMAAALIAAPGRAQVGSPPTTTMGTPSAGYAPGATYGYGGYGASGYGTSGYGTSGYGSSGYGT